jgi:SAM-dependent methyltransferase
MWHVKLVKDALKSTLPFQTQLRKWKRRISPYEGLQDNNELALLQGLQQINLLQVSGANLAGDVLEIGSGWLPIIPLLFRLAGARRLVLTDVEQLMDGHTIAVAKRAIERSIDRVSDVLGKPTGLLLDRLAEPFAPEYHTPWNSGKFLKNSADIVISRAVFEHIPPTDLLDLIDDLGRILRPDGLMCHIIDNSDHWEHQDHNISRVNFLRFENGMFWRIACMNRQSYQNRLRHSDYTRLFIKSGWTAVVAAGEPDPGCLEDLRSLPLASQFESYDQRDLAILTSTFVLCRLDPIGLT